MSGADTHSIFWWLFEHLPNDVGNHVVRRHLCLFRVGNGCISRFIYDLQGHECIVANISIHLTSLNVEESIVSRIESCFSGFSSYEEEMR